MNLRHAAALALVGWYLMMPPLDQDTRDWNTAAPFSEWTTIKSFHSKKDCRVDTHEALEAYRIQHFRDATPTPEYEGILRCVANNDPRLKEK